MIKALLKQKYEHFEVVICDNDPQGSSGSTIKKFKSKKIQYHVNPKNLGMVKSFNRAFELSKGELIVFMSDDDPPYPSMLHDLVKLYRRHPECVAYFGAYDLYTPEDELASTIKMPKGYLSCRNFDWPRGAVKVFEPATYLKKALDGDIFYYLMWSTCFVKRDVVKKIKAIPSYGSALMTDRAYCLKVGAMGKSLVYNKELGSQLVHGQSFSLTSADAEILTKGFVGYYRDIQKYLAPYHLEKENEAFILRHLVNMFLIIKVGDEIRHTPTNTQFLMRVFDDIATQLPFLQKHRLALRLMLWRRFPFEVIFKALQLSPRKLYKTTTRFLQHRLQLNTTKGKS
jgi:glycosyltransferase involved in cell wall biosynthesis